MQAAHAAATLLRRDKAPAGMSCPFLLGDIARRREPRERVTVQTVTTFHIATSALGRPGVSAAGLAGTLRIRADQTTGRRGYRGRALGRRGGTREFRIR